MCVRTISGCPPFAIKRWCWSGGVEDPYSCGSIIESSFSGFVLFLQAAHLMSLGDLRCAGFSKCLMSERMHGKMP